MSTLLQRVMCLLYMYFVCFDICSIDVEFLCAGLDVSVIMAVQEAKRWPPDLAVPGPRSAAAEIFQTIRRGPFYTAFHCSIVRYY